MCVKIFTIGEITNMKSFTKCKDFQTLPLYIIILHIDGKRNNYNYIYTYIYMWGGAVCWGVVSTHFPP